MNATQILFVLILAGTLVLFITDRVRIDIAAMMTLLALAFSGILTPAEALSGFASEPAIIVAAVFVISAAMNATGLTESMGELIARAGGRREWRVIAVTMPTVAVLAALSHHLMITAMMLPILLRLARTHELPASRLLMPMSLAASLGTTLTLFSAPAFLLTSNLLKRQGDAELSVFAITPIGIVLVLLGIAYMSFGRWLLPRRTAQGDDTDFLKLDSYYTELIVMPESPWVGQPLKDFQTHMQGRLTVLSWLRHGLARLRAPDATLEPGDVFIVRTRPEEIASIDHEPGIELHAIAKYGDSAKEQEDDTEAPRLVQVVVAPHSPFVGNSIRQIDFLKNLRVVVVGLWRKDEWLRDEMSQVRLREGDLLVLRGTPRRLAELNQHRGFLMMMPFAARALHRNRAIRALLVVGAALGAIALGLAPVHLIFLTAAVALIVLGCVTTEQAYCEIDVRVFVMIAGVVPLGLAMEKTGTAALVASHLQTLTGDWSSFAVLLTLFWAGALLTQILSDAATAVLLVPISLALAARLGLPPEPFAVCTALGAVAAFLTPIGHHGNLLILTPGQYTFGDFLKVGVPLTILISLTSAWLAGLIWLTD